MVHSLFKAIRKWLNKNKVFSYQEVYTKLGSKRRELNSLKHLIIRQLKVDNTKYKYFVDVKSKETIVYVWFVDRYNLSETHNLSDLKRTGLRINIDPEAVTEIGSVGSFNEKDISEVLHIIHKKLS